jgi:hypothetical protein
MISVVSLKFVEKVQMLLRDSSRMQIPLLSQGEFAPENLNPSLAKRGRGDFRTERRASYTTNFSSRTLA